MERAVLLSDIEFLDGVHESDWERIEEESFLVNVSKPLNENQQVVLEWLKEGDNSPFAMISTLDDDFVGIDTGCLIPAKVREGFVTLSNIEQFQVLAAFAEWGGMKNEQ